MDPLWSQVWQVNAKKQNAVAALQQVAKEKKKVLMTEELQVAKEMAGQLSQQLSAAVLELEMTEERLKEKIDYNQALKGENLIIRKENEELEETIKNMKKQLLKSLTSTLNSYQ